MGYFTSWCGYSHHYTADNIPADDLTHLFYAFANVVDGKCVLGDKFADAEKSWPGDVWNQPVKGNFNQINNVIKSKHPHLKTLISVGGWSWSKDFSDIAAKESSRKVFASSCVDFMKKYGFDGIDIDWEFPVSGGMPDNHYRPDDGKNYEKLLGEVRKELKKQGEDYLLTIAAPAGYQKFKNIPLKSISKHLDWFNIMTYDYNACWGAGTDSDFASHHTALYHSDADPSKADKRLNSDSTVKGFLDAMVPKEKIAIGAAFYGKGYEDLKKSNSSDSWLFSQYKKCPQGTWDDWTTGPTGTFDYVDIEKKLNDGQWKRYWDEKANAPYIVKETGNNANDVLISYDDAESLTAKADYSKKHSLAGLFAWSLDGDTNNNLIKTIREANSDAVSLQRTINKKMTLHVIENNSPPNTESAAAAPAQPGVAAVAPAQPVVAAAATVVAAQPPKSKSKGWFKNTFKKTPKEDPATPVMAKKATSELTEAEKYLAKQKEELQRQVDIQKAINQKSTTVTAITAAIVTAPSPAASSAASASAAASSAASASTAASSAASASTAASASHSPSKSQAAPVLIKSKQTLINEKEQDLANSYLEKAKAILAEQVAQQQLINSGAGTVQPPITTPVLTNKITAKVEKKAAPSPQAVKLPQVPVVQAKAAEPPAQQSESSPAPKRVLKGIHHFGAGDTAETSDHEHSSSPASWFHNSEKKLLKIFHFDN